MSCQTYLTYDTELWIDNQELYRLRGNPSSCYSHSALRMTLQRRNQGSVFLPKKTSKAVVSIISNLYVIRGSVQPGFRISKAQ